MGERELQIEKELSEIVILCNEKLSEMNRIKGQIEFAKAKLNVDGEQYDKKWMQKAKYALRVISEQRQEALRKRGELGRELKEIKKYTKDALRLNAFKSVVKSEYGEDVCFDLFSKALMIVEQYEN